MKYAKIITTQVKGSTGKQYLVRSGRQGKGKVLFACTAWDQATFESYCMCRDWLEENGYTGVNEDGEKPENLWKAAFFQQA